MSPRTFPSSNPSLDLDRWIDQIERRIGDIEAGRNRGPGSSFGVPFRVTNGTTTWSISIDANGRLVAINEFSGVPTILA